jgi:hypothetical protein
VGYDRSIGVKFAAVAATLPTTGKFRLIVEMQG